VKWFRWYHGAATDPKLGGVAMRSKASLPEVIATWALVLENASASDERGDVSIDAHEVAYVLRVEPEAVEAILSAMTDAGMLSEGRVASWEKRQPKRDMPSTERVAKHRAAQVKHDETRTQHAATPETRVDKSRLDTDKIKDIGSNEPSRRKRISYTPEFEDGLWKPYPNTAGMSKPEAFAAWKALTAEERQQATDRLPAFIKWMAGQGKDYRTLHACRYLSKKRFESLEPVAIAAVSGVPIRLNTPQHRAWQQYHFERREISRDHAFKASRYGADMDMREETEWPPNTLMEAAE